MSDIYSMENYYYYFDVIVYTVSKLFSIVWICFII